MVIGIDMDDTICSTNELIIVEADKYDKEVLGGTGVKDVKAYEFADMLGWGKEMKGQFFSDRLEHIMANAEIKENAKEVINKLYDEGNKIIFISFRKAKYIKDPYMLTKTWLDNHGVKYHDIFTDTGSKVDECVDNNVTLFIDDKESHCEEVSNAGIDVILFTNAYNSEEKRFVRKDTWTEVYDYIQEKYYG
ncbi:MAG: hypothetical protein GX758_00430 [Tenericutes bacterium]|nr:hypothetical protein [Mycoplasmatota bacterium]